MLHGPLNFAGQICFYPISAASTVFVLARSGRSSPTRRQVPKLHIDCPHALAAIDLKLKLTFYGFQRFSASLLAIGIWPDWHL